VKGIPSSSSVGGAGRNSVYRTLAFVAIYTLTPVLVPPFISKGTPRQKTCETSVTEMRNYCREMAGQI
jgi:hypothetical protein